MDVRNNFCYLCKSRLSLVINGSPTKPCPCPCYAQYAHISNSISLLCECGSTFNLYLVHTHTQRDRRQARQMHRSNVWQHVLVPIRLTCAQHTHAHTRRTYISLYRARCAYDISVCTEGGEGEWQHLCKLKCK